MIFCFHCRTIWSCCSGWLLERSSTLNWHRFAWFHIFCSPFPPCKWKLLEGGGWFVTEKRGILRFILDRSIQGWDWKVFLCSELEHSEIFQIWLYASFSTKARKLSKVQLLGEHRLDFGRCRPEKILFWRVGWEEIHSCSGCLWKCCFLSLWKPASIFFFAPSPLIR